MHELGLTCRLQRFYVTQNGMLTFQYYAIKKNSQTYLAFTFEVQFYYPRRFTKANFSF